MYKVMSTHGLMVETDKVKYQRVGNKWIKFKYKEELQTTTQANIGLMILIKGGMHQLAERTFGKLSGDHTDDSLLFAQWWRSIPTICTCQGKQCNS